MHFPSVSSHLNVSPRTAGIFAWFGHPFVSSVRESAWPIFAIRHIFWNQKVIVAESIQKWYINWDKQRNAYKSQMTAESLEVQGQTDISNEMLNFNQDIQKEPVKWLNRRFQNKTWGWSCLRGMKKWDSKFCFESKTHSLEAQCWMRTPAPLLRA